MKRVLRRVPLLAWIIAPLAIGALIAWPLGGWDTVTLVSRELPEYESNQVFETQRFDIRVDDAWLTQDGHPAGYSPPTPLDEDDPPETYLIVDTEFTNLTNDPAVGSEVRGYVVPIVDGVDTGEYGTFSSYLADGTGIPELNPGVTVRMLLVFTIPESAVQAGDDLRLDLYNGIRYKSVLGAGYGWDLKLAGFAVRNVDER